jgi:hypothetical protein
VPTIKRSLLSTVLVIAIAALSGCFPSRTEWVKEGATTDDLRSARNGCEGEAGRYRFLDDSPYDDARKGQPNVASAQSNDYRRCMESQGWRRERMDQKATSR